MNDLFLETLAAKRPHPSLGAHAETYGRLIGSWVGEAHNHMVEGHQPITSIEVHFGWCSMAAPCRTPGSRLHARIAVRHLVTA